MKLPFRIKAIIEAYCACLLHQQLRLQLLRQKQLRQKQERTQQAQIVIMADAVAEMVVGDEHRKDRMGSALNAMVASAPPTQQRMAFPVPTERPDMSRILETREKKATAAPWYCDNFRGDSAL